MWIGGGGSDVVGVMNVVTPPKTELKVERNQASKKDRSHEYIPKALAKAG